MSLNKILVVSFLTLTLISLATSFLDFGIACKPEEQEPGGDNRLICDPYGNLACQNNSCNCRSLTDMKYYPNSTANNRNGSCHVLSGGNCDNIEFSGTTITTFCVEKAECNQGPDFRICSCEEDSLETDERTCFPKVSYEDTCSETEPCYSEEHLECRHDTCLCPNALDQSFLSWTLNNVTTRGCFALVFAPCQPSNETSSVPCLPKGTTCSEDSQSPTGFSCICDESQGWIPTLSRECRKGFNAECTSHYSADWKGEDWCNSNDAELICFNNKCVCQYEPDQEWDEKLQMCASMEGKTCSLIEDGGHIILCKSGLTCVTNPGLSWGQCRNVTEGDQTTIPSTTVEIDQTTVPSTTVEIRQTTVPSTTSEIDTTTGSTRTTDNDSTTKRDETGSGSVANIFSRISFFITIVQIFLNLFY